jgi:RNA polymerase sigma-70 factor, ECF subfamily
MRQSCWRRYCTVSIKHFGDPLHLVQVGTTEVVMSPSLTNFEDHALIERVLAGHAESFAVLMDRHFAGVRRRIDGMAPNGVDADDLQQEVLLKVWRRLSTFRAKSSFRTWMTRVAINEVLQAYRREKRRPAYQPLEDLAGIASPAESPHQSLARVEAKRAVRRAVLELPAKYRQVLVLRDFHELSSRETAQSLQSSIPAVKTRLLRARLMVAAALQQPKSRGLANAPKREAPE